MQKIIWIFTALIAVSLTSCITIEERYTIKKNGSGHMEYIIDMSEMASLLEMLPKDEDDEEAGDNPLSGLSEGLGGADMGDIAAKLEGMEGISKVTQITGDNELYMGIGFDFKSVEALNNAVSSFNEGGGMTPITFDGKKFVREQELAGELNMEELLGDSEEVDAAQMNMFFTQMKYKVSVTFKKPINAIYTSGDAKFTDKKHKSMEVETSFKELFEGENPLNFSVITK